jgi:hypothetical protein
MPVKATQNKKANTTALQAPGARIDGSVAADVNLPTVK